MRYRYKAVDREGRVRRGLMTADHPQALEATLASLNLDLIRFKALHGGRARWSSGVRRQQLMHFCYQLEQLLSAGVPMLEALREVQQSEDHDTRLRTALATAAARVESGKTLSEALEEFPAIFTDIITSLVRVGEESGHLPEMLHELAEMLAWQDEVAARATLALLYPVFLGFFLGAATLYLFVYLVPKLLAFLRTMQETLPLQTRVLAAVSEFVVQYWPALVAAPVVSIMLAVYAMRRFPTIRLVFHWILIRAPLLGDILRKLALARFCRAFALLYRGGIPVLDILSVARQVPANLVLTNAIDAARSQIENGRSVHDAFRVTATFPPLMLRMVAVGESTGDLDKTLLKASEIYDRDARERLGRVEALIEPVLTLVLGAMLGWIMLSILGPLYDLTTRVR